MDVCPDATTLPIGDEIKALGICWNTRDDCLQYKIQAVEKNNCATKRSVLSTIAQIYDPLGLMGPAIVLAKVILQQIWKLKLGWDESLPLDLHTKWTQHLGKMDNVSLISIPRHVMCPEPHRIEIHGFCDASEAAYGACIYIRSLNNRGEIFVHLLCAKSKVAPLKRVTLPRFELCGALLLTKLGQLVQRSLTIKFEDIHYWSDSTIALAWIKHRPEKLQTFVANRVADFQRIAPEAQWSRIRLKDNPADILSRGTTPENLKNFQLWWNGPAWLTLDRQEWPKELVPISNEQIPEIKIYTMVFHSTSSSRELFIKFSSLSRLKRVTAYCLRFKNNILNKSMGRLDPYQ